MDERYERCIEYVLRHEGGLSNNINDVGGITNYGISIKLARDIGDFELFDVDGDGKINSQDIKKMTKEIAKKIYYKYFWNPLKLSMVKDIRICLLILDAGINHGIFGASKLVQKTLNLCKKKEKKDDDNLYIDGIIGIKTLKQLNRVNVDEFINNFNKKREDLYRAIVNKNPTQECFLNGWLNRIAQCNKEIKEIKE